MTSRKRLDTVLVLACVLVGTMNVHAQREQGDETGETLYFRERTGDEVVYLESSEEQSGSGLLLRSESDRGDVHEVRVDGDLHTQQWHYISSENQVDYTARLRGDEIVIEGVNEGETVNERRRLRDDDPWIQSIEKSLEPFVLSDDDRMEFWTIQPDSLDLRKLLAKRSGPETVDVDGEQVEAWRVRISLPGIGSIFWGAEYWYRTSDGQFVRYEGTRGPPGTPETVVEKIDRSEYR